MNSFLDDNELQAVEDLIAETQFRIITLMEQRNMRPADLAKALNISRPRVSQLLDARPNLTLATIARIFYALNEKPVLTSGTLEKLFPADSEKLKFAESNMANWLRALAERPPICVDEASQDVGHTLQRANDNVILLELNAAA